MPEAIQLNGIIPLNILSVSVLRTNYMKCESRIQIKYTALKQHLAQQMTEAFLDCKRNHLLGSQTRPTN